MKRNTIPTLMMTMMMAAGVPLAAEGTANGPHAEAILQELRAIRLLLEKGAVNPPQQAPEPAMPQMAAAGKLPVDPAMALGRADAPITIVEFTDIQCGFCKRFHQQAFAEIREKLILTGKARFVSRDFPLDLGSFSVQAAEAVRCAGEQGKYWPLRDLVMSAAGPVSAESLSEMARKVGVAVPQMNACVESHKYRAAIEADVKEGVKLNVAGTPSFVIGKSTAEGVEGVTMVGAQNFEAFAAKIREVEGKK